MVWEVILYDEYSDIPLRGIIRTDSSILAFDACVLADEPAEIAGRPGVYSKVRGFQCDEALRLLMEEKDSVFRKWRAAFDNGLVDESTHPLCTDPRYQHLSRSVGAEFSRLSDPVLEATGLMRVFSGKFEFECVHVTPMRKN